MQLLYPLLIIYCLSWLLLTLLLKYWLKDIARSIPDISVLLDYMAYIPIVNTIALLLLLYGIIKEQIVFITTMRTVNRTLKKNGHPIIKWWKKTK